MATKFSIDATFRAIDRMTKPVKKMSSNIKRSMRGVSGQINKTFRRDLGRAQQRVKNFGKNLKRNLAVGAGVAAFAFIRMGNAAAEAFKKQQGAVANVEAGLKSTNNALGITSKELQNIAAAQQAAGIFGDEDILQNVTAQLLTFGGIGKQVFERTQLAAQDVAAKLKGVNATGADLQSTSIMLGKALEDPLRGMGALRRVGISFNAEQEKQIKTMVKAGKTVEAQELILASIEKQYGGTAAALAGTDAGKIIQAQNKIGDAMEKIGEKFLPMKALFLEFVLSIMPIAQEVFATISAGFVDMAPTIKLAAKALSVIFKMFFAVLKVVRPFLPIILSIIAAFKIYSTVLTVVTAAQALLNIVMTANPIGLIILAVAALIGIIIMLVKNWDTVVAFLKAGAEKVLGDFIYMGTAIGNFIYGVFNKIISDFLFVVGAVKNALFAVHGFFVSVGTAIGGFISGVFNKIISDFLFVVGAVKNALFTVHGFFVSVGTAIGGFMATVWDGIKFGFSVAISFIKKILFTVADYFLSIWGGIINGILTAASAVGGALGIDTSAVDNVINKVAGLQKKVRGESFIGDAVGERGIIGSGVQTQSQTTSQSIQTNNNNQTVTLRNEAMGITANSGGRETKTGQSLSIAPSGA